MRARGFSLLEVMVALAIFGLMISGILGAQAGLAASNRKAANMGQATTLARCKMSELEEKVLKLGFPAMDEKDTDTLCCEGADTSTFKCDYRIDTIVLPDPPTSSMDMDGGAASKLLGMAGDGGLNASLDFDSGLSSMATMFGAQTGGGGAAGLVDMAMGIVYPMMKPMMEASIRKITVTVKWNEGKKPNDFVLCQYITNPQSGGFTGGLFGDAGLGSSATGAGSAGSQARPVPTGTAGH